MDKEDEKQDNEGKGTSDPDSNEAGEDVSEGNIEDGVQEEPKMDMSGAVEEAEEAREDNVQASSLATPNQEVKQSSGEQEMVKTSKEENGEKSEKKELAKSSSKHAHVPHVPHMPHMTRQQKEDFRKFLWNKEKKSCCGRNAKSWGAILLFYLVFYIILAGAMALCLFVMTETIRDDQPKWSHQSETNVLSIPGMNSVPTETRLLQSATGSSEYPEMDFSMSDESSYGSHVDKLKKLMEGYGKKDSIELPDNCGSDETHTCEHSVSKYGPCSGDTDETFGYDQGEPCIAMRINKVHGWRPKMLSENPLPDEISDYDPTSIPVTCEEVVGKNEKPILTNETHFQFFPATGFPENCFPFCGHRFKSSNFVSPFVMVKLLNFPKKKMVRVWCKMWLSDIKKHYIRDVNGGLRFEIEIRE